MGEGIKAGRNKVKILYFILATGGTDLDSSTGCTATVGTALTLSRALPPISHHATSRSSHLGSSHRGTAMHLGLDDVYHWVSFPIERGRFFRSRLLHAVSLHA
ncbi:uncharacterized protein CLUP02_09260 [Colletotrichum lupini]|uniref:Uncharacterized protein n=1 Tax=Colletotrichum lupini TaxID=145971 RepID=A0A9Q8SUG1_9PEZI|nr:uncharacterized protein CLUP02_09260 [Colletotrichum lupini]UQC83764.1 hypothetical protein CLUP02_09260 [Colletotrichum lupini]